ncbi:T-complex protein 1 subunit eta [Pseudogymnoascus australis]
MSFGTDSSQGKGQVISNINACLAVQETIRSTLGPYGGDLLLVDENGRQTITNDGATVMKLLDIVHPAARILTDIARSQDAEVGDGTTSVVVLAGEILKEIKEHVEQGVSSQTIIKGLRRASMMSVNKIKEIAVNTNEGNQRDTLTKLAGTAMSSKLIKRNTGFFTKMVVDAVLTLDQDDLNENLIGVKKIAGGSLTDSLFVNGVAFKKTFSYAGFEQQPKSFKNPKIVCLNVELELKSEKDNAEVRVEQVSEYQAIVDAEWQIIYNKMEAVYKSGAKVVLSKLPIGDLATQYFADRDIFCAGRVASADLDRIIQACGGSIQSTCSDIHPEHLGVCGRFEEKQIGNERYNFFEDCPEAKTCTLVLRGGAEQFIAEVERSLHDAIMIVKRAIKHNTIVAGGGACEMEISAYLHRYADKSISNKQQAIIKSFAKALEVIPRQLCDNAGFDATDILNKLRVEHRKGSTWAGVDFVNEGIADNMEKFVWEPALVKINAIQAATEASCLILSVDETIKNEESQAPQAPGQQLPPGAAQRALRDIMGIPFDYAPERPEHIEAILNGLDRYNPETTTIFQDYVQQQCDDKAYDCYANLALLKLYQFNPHLARDETITNTLVKALTVFPSPDFSLCLHLLPAHILQPISTSSALPAAGDAPLSEAVQKLAVLSNLLAGASYAKFWSTLDSDDLYADLIADVNGFEELIRIRIAMTVSQAVREVERSVLESWLGLQGEALDKFVSEVCGWQVEGTVVKVPLNKENEAKGTMVRENVKIDQFSRVVRRAYELPA